MELVRLHSRGGFSVRSFITLCLAVLIAAFFWATFNSSAAQAQAPAATWQNESMLLYDGHAFQASPTTMSQSHGLAEGTTIFTYTEPAGQSATATRGAYFIYFAPGTDPPTATSAEYARYTLSGETFSNPQDQATIEVTPFGQEDDRSSCEVSGGLGWIICPVTIFLANSMDSLFDLVANFLAVKPLTLDPSSNNSLYNVWNVMRNVANIAFVIAFLLIIYAQITSMGVSSYGMKKMVPRLVIAAVLVNASFLISALAIDVSNILGFSIQDIFIAIRENTFYMTDDTTAGNVAFNSQWTQWTTVILGGGGVIGGVGVAVYSGAIFLLLPLLASLALTLFVVLIVLAARQAIIVVLVIIAPLAFVANLLPNTEKWFGKWRDLFMTMLIFFPAFSLIFGGSQLAGQVIIQNAGDDIIMILFGMAVQVAPLVITPLIFKLSGNLLGKIAQIANNPNKGLVDRTRKFSTGMAEQQRQKTLGKKMDGASKYNLAARMVQSGEKRRRLREDRTGAYKAEGDNRYHEDPRYSKIHDATEAANLDKERLHNEHQAHFEKQRNTKPAPGTRQRRNYESIYDRSLRAEAAKDMLAEQQANTAGHYDTLRTVGGTPLNASRNQAEAAKSNAEAAAQNLSAYQSERRTFKSTEMGKAAINLETAKLNAEGQQSKLTAHIDGLKIKEGTTLHSAAQFAQSSKEHAETAQHNVQTMFDHQRKTQGTALNISSTALQDAQLKANEAKSLTEKFFNDAKSDQDGVLHVQHVMTERAKTAQQRSETRLTRVVEEYKSGSAANIPSALTTVVQEMAEEVVDLAAETRGVQAAQNIQKKAVATAFTASDTPANSARAERLLATAGSVDPQGKNRAKANAIAQLDAINKEALSNNKALIEDEADGMGMRLEDYLKHIIKKNPTKPEEWGGELPDPEFIEATWDMAAESGFIEELHSARKKGSGVDQQMLNRVAARNASSLKGKGALDFATNYKLADATEEKLDVGIAYGFGAVNADSFASLPFPWLQYISDKENLDRIRKNVAEHVPDPNDPDEPMPKGAAFYDGMIEGLLTSATEALRSPEILSKLGTKKAEIIKMHKALYAKYGDVDAPDGTSVSRSVNYAAVEAGIPSPKPE